MPLAISDAPGRCYRRRLRARVEGIAVPETVGRITALEQRVGTMDIELKEYFSEFRAFTSHALAGVEKRLGTRIDGLETRLGGLESRMDRLETRLDRFERDVKAGFQVVDGRLGRLERRLDRIEGRLDHIDRKLDMLIRRLPTPARATGPKRRRSRKTSR